jgi:hypothetical protein
VFQLLEHNLVYQIRVMIRQSNLIGTKTYSDCEDSDNLTEKMRIQSFLPVPSSIKAENVKLERGNGGSAMDESKDHGARFLSNGSTVRSRELLASLTLNNVHSDIRIFSD